MVILTTKTSRNGEKKFIFGYLHHLEVKTIPSALHFATTSLLFLRNKERSVDEMREKEEEIESHNFTKNEVPLCIH